MNGVPKWLVWAAAGVLGAGGTGWTISNGEDVSSRVAKLETRVEIVVRTLERIEDRLGSRQWEP